MFFQTIFSFTVSSYQSKSHSDSEPKAIVSHKETFKILADKREAWDTSHCVSLTTLADWDGIFWFDVTARVVILDWLCLFIYYRGWEEQVDRSTNTDILRVKLADPRSARIHSLAGISPNLEVEQPCVPYLGSGNINCDPLVLWLLRCTTLDSYITGSTIVLLMFLYMQLLDSMK